MSRTTVTTVALMFPLLLAFTPLVSAQGAAGIVAPGSAQDWLVPGEIADRTFQRYADSFSQPIPETLNRDEFISDDSGGGGSK